jgi:hypothetical protein
LRMPVHGKSRAVLSISSRCFGKRRGDGRNAVNDQVFPGRDHALLSARRRGKRQCYGDQRYPVKALHWFDSFQVNCLPNPYIL